MYVHAALCTPRTFRPRYFQTPVLSDPGTSFQTRYLVSDPVPRFRPGTPVLTPWESSPKSPHTGWNPIPGAPLRSHPGYCTDTWSYSWFPRQPRKAKKSICGVRGYQYAGYEGMKCGYEGINMRGTRGWICGVRGYQYPGYEGINIRGTRVSISGVRGYEGINMRYQNAYPGYKDINNINIRAIKISIISISGV